MVARRIGSVGAPISRPPGPVARLRNATATSAGGIVIRHVDGAPHLVVGHRRRERDDGTWTLPKGTPNEGETIEETALREVREETGLEVRITQSLDSIEYWFVQGDRRVHKTVHYFLMEQTGGSLADHDHEFDDVRWVPLSSAAATLTFPTERSLVDRAVARLGRVEEPLGRLEEPLGNGAPPDREEKPRRPERADRGGRAGRDRVPS